MQPYTRLYPSQLVTTSTFRQPDGSYATYTSVGWEPAAVSETFTCSSQNGNKSDPLPMSFEKRYTELGFGTLTDVNTSSGTTISIVRSAGPIDAGAGNIIPRASDLSYNQALERLYSRIRSGVDLSVAMAESGKTVKMVKPLKAYARWVTSINPKTWHSRWLEYQYGWRPLAMDVYGALEEYQRRIPKIARLRGLAATTYSRKRTANSSQHIHRSVQTESYRTLIGVLYEQNPSLVEAIGQYTGLNPLGIAWELTPYSFVADWFLGVGDYLKNVETAAVYGAGFRGGYVTKTSLLVHQSTRSGNGKTVSGSRIVGSTQGTLRIATKDRTVLSGLPRPELPKFSLELGSQRLISAAALLRNFIDDAKTPVQHNRRVTNERIDRALANFGRGPRLWSSRAGNAI